MLEAKKQFKGKNYVEWVQANCPFSYASLQNYVKVAEKWHLFDEEALSEFTLTEFLAAVSERAPTKRKKTNTKEEEATKDREPTQTAVASEPAAEATTTPVLEIVAVHETPAPRSRSGYTPEYVERMAAECGVIGDVVEFLMRFGVLVEAALAA